MQRISNEELKKIEAGGFSLSLGLIFGGIATFLIGIIDGFTRPLACHK